MTAIKRSIALGWISTLGLAGCLMPERLDGDYEGMLNLKIVPGTDPVVANQLRLVKLTAREDGTATVIDGSVPVTGNLTYGSKSATFAPDKIAGSLAEQNPQLIGQYQAVLTPLAKGVWRFKTDREEVVLHKVGSGSK